MGLRSGDIVGESFDDVTYEDGAGPWLLRVTYGLLFFLVIGVILFDIVTGIIIDRFSALRQDSAERDKYFLEVPRSSLPRVFPRTFSNPQWLFAPSQTSIISNITRSDCEEHHLKFSDVIKPGLEDIIECTVQRNFEEFATLGYCRNLYDQICKIANY